MRAVHSTHYTFYEGNSVGVVLCIFKCVTIDLRIKDMAPEAIN